MSSHHNSNENRFLKRKCHIVFSVSSDLLCFPSNTDYSCKSMRPIGIWPILLLLLLYSCEMHTVQTTFRCNAFLHFNFGFFNALHCKQIEFGISMKYL